MPAPDPTMLKQARYSVARPTLQTPVSPQETQLRQDAIRITLKREAKRSKLENLEELSLSLRRSETRIWVGFMAEKRPVL